MIKIPMFHNWLKKQHKITHKKTSQKTRKNTTFRKCNKKHPNKNIIFEILKRTYLRKTTILDYYLKTPNHETHSIENDRKSKKKKLS